MNLADVKTQLLEWLKHFHWPRNWEDHIVEEPECVRLYFHTSDHQYSIVAKPTYLGCVVTERKPLPGEDWTRGNDLADGLFSHETWVRILSDIVGYETLKLVQPMRKQRRFGGEPDERVPASSDPIPATNEQGS